MRSKLLSRGLMKGYSVISSEGVRVGDIDDDWMVFDNVLFVCLSMLQDTYLRKNGAISFSVHVDQRPSSS